VASKTRSSVSTGRFYPPANVAILSSGSEYLASRGRRTLTQRQGRHLSPDCHPGNRRFGVRAERETIMIFAASWAISARLHNLFRRFAPSNILIRRVHTRTGIKWRPLAGLAAAVLYGLLMLATATVVRKGGPGWVDLIVLLAFWNTLKFTCLIPVSLIRLVRVRHQERVPMTEHSRLPSDPRIAERAIVLQLLRDDHDEQWSRVELETELDDVEPMALSDAIADLERHGVAVVQGERILASRCARHLDELGLIAI
jgi:hypothetical protein